MHPSAPPADPMDMRSRRHRWREQRRYAPARNRARITHQQYRGDSVINVQSIDELAQRLAALVPPGLREAREDLTANFRSALQSGLRHLDLVTREEFDVQRCVLLRTREKIEQLEAQVAALERFVGSNDTQPKH
jgi:ubiquinone biosynthesis accessory factor UbiK